MFNLLNQFNLSLQKRDANILLSQNKITAFIKKLNIWKAKINDNIVNKFSVLFSYIASKLLINSELIFSDIQEYLQFVSYSTKYILKETWKC